MKQNKQRASYRAPQVELWPVSAVRWSLLSSSSLSLQVGDYEDHSVVEDWGELS